MATNQKRLGHLSIRVSDTLRSALEKAARKSGRDLTDEARVRLHRSLDTDRILERAFGAPHIRALCVLFGRLIDQVESMTGLSWRQDRYTLQAVQAGERLLVEQLGGQGAPSVPARVALFYPSEGLTKEQVEKLTKNELAELARDKPWRDPSYIGESIALGLLDQLRVHQTAPQEELPSSTTLTDTFYLFPQIVQDLAAGLKKRQ